MSVSMYQLVRAELQQEAQKAQAKIFATAAWEFAHCVLWSGQKFKRREINKAKEFLENEYLRQSNKKAALIVFCERILVQTLFLKNKQHQISNPSYWFNPIYLNGYSGTYAAYKKIEEQRQYNPNAFLHFCLLATFYKHYCKRPSNNLFYFYRKRLIDLKAKNILGYFYALVSHCQHKIV